MNSSELNKYLSALVGCFGVLSLLISLVWFLATYDKRIYVLEIKSVQIDEFKKDQEKINNVVDDITDSHDKLFFKLQNEIENLNRDCRIRN